MTRKPDARPGSPLYILLPLVGRKAEDIDEGSRDLVFRLIGDADAETRRCALEIAERLEVGETEARTLEGLLARQGSEFRRALLRNLLRQADLAALASAQRLLKSPDQKQRLGGLELLRRMIDTGRSVEQCRAVAAPWKKRKDELSSEERKALEPFRA